MADIIDFNSHPITHIRRTKSLKKHILDLIEFFVNAEEDKRFYIMDSLSSHKGYSAIILCAGRDEPIAAWIVKSEEVTHPIFAMVDHSIVSKNMPYTILHITDDDVYGITPIDTKNALQFAALMPVADWYAKACDFDM